MFETGSRSSRTLSAYRGEADASRDTRAMDEIDVIDEITHAAARVIHTDPVITSSQYRNKYQRLKRFFRK